VVANLRKRASFLHKSRPLTSCCKRTLKLFKTVAVGVPNKPGLDQKVAAEGVAEAGVVAAGLLVARRLFGAAVLLPFGCVSMKLFLQGEKNGPGENEEGGEEGEKEKEKEEVKGTGGHGCGALFPGTLACLCYGYMV